MQKASEAVSKFLHKDGKNDTTVHENVAPAVTNERVNRTQHNEQTTALDREVHKDHYHTSVQPIQNKEVLPEQHTYNTAGVQERRFDHGDATQDRAKIEAEAARYKNTRTVGETQHQKSQAATVTGEHIHHHVHETIQPVIQKETVQNSVLHTTIPIHETHYAEGEVKPTTTLPAMSMSDYKSQEPTSLKSSSTRADGFQGGPKRLNDTLNPHKDLGTIGGAGAEGSTSLTGDLDSHVGPSRGEIPAQKASYGTEDNVAHRSGGLTSGATASSGVKSGGISSGGVTSGTSTTSSAASTAAIKDGVQGTHTDHTSSVTGHSDHSRTAKTNDHIDSETTSGEHEKQGGLFSKLKYVVTGHE